MPAEAAAAGPIHGAFPSHATPLSKRLWDGTSCIAWRCLYHPFVRALADATLPPCRFRFYVAQDATFLAAFAAAYATARTAAAGDEDAVAVLTTLAAAVQEELRLHSAYATAWGVDPAALAAPPAPATAAYCRYLDLAGDGYHGKAKVQAILAAMAPCSRLYGFLGCALAEAGVVGASPAPHPFADWVETYSSQAYLAAPAAKEALLDRLAGEVEEGKRNGEMEGRVEGDEGAFFTQLLISPALDAGTRSAAYPFPPGRCQARTLTHRFSISGGAARPRPLPTTPGG